MPEAPQWARVRGDVNCNVRRGAWYEVVRVSPEDVVLDVNQRTVSIARTSVQIVPIRPQRWSVVARPQDADQRSEEHTSELQSRQYLVCRLLLEKKKQNNEYNQNQHDTT